MWYNNTFGDLILLSVVHYSLFKVHKLIHIVLMSLRTAASEANAQLSGPDRCVHDTFVFLRISHTALVVGSFHKLLLLLAEISLLTLLHLL